MKSSPIFIASFFSLLAVAGSSRGQEPAPSSLEAPGVIETGNGISVDGTLIGYSKYGKGPALVVCHGTHTVAEDWAPFARELGKHYTVYLYDRRGRGRSPDDGKPYTPASEINDLAAIVRAAGPDTAILGHGFGGGVALAYAVRNKFKGRLVLYEPDHSVPRKASGGHLPELQSLIEKNELEKATSFAFESIAGMPKDEAAKLKQSPAWPGMVQLNRLFPREVWLLDQLQWTPEQLQKLQCRTWILLGSLTRAEPNETSRVAALVDRIPGLTLYPLIGQGHVAYLEDPALLVKVVERCLMDE